MEWARTRPSTHHHGKIRAHTIIPTLVSSKLLPPTEDGHGAAGRGSKGGCGGCVGGARRGSVDGRGSRGGGVGRSGESGRGGRGDVWDCTRARANTRANARANSMANGMALCFAPRAMVRMSNDPDTWVCCICAKYWNGIGGKRQIPDIMKPPSRGPVIVIIFTAGSPRFHGIQPIKYTSVH